MSLTNLRRLLVCSGTAISCGQVMAGVLAVAVSAKEDVISPFSAMTNKKTKDEQKNEKARLAETHAMIIITTCNNAFGLCMEDKLDLEARLTVSS